MPRIQETTVYQFNELEDRAKERARDWWRGLEQQDFDTEFVIDDAARMGALLGITFKTRPVALMSGKTRLDPCVYWSGFSSQGDGASFEGTYCYAKGAPAAIRKKTGSSESILIDLAERLQAIQKRHNYKLTAVIETGRYGLCYSHSGTMSVDVDGWAAVAVETIGDEEKLTACMREFADWIYRQLEAEYTWRMADEQVDDAITANEYEFTIDGRHV